jgi:hypothetical protein
MPLGPKVGSEEKYKPTSLACIGLLERSALRALMISYCLNIPQNYFKLY